MSGSSGDEKTKQQFVGIHRHAGIVENNMLAIRRSCCIKAMNDLENDYIIVSGFGNMLDYSIGNAAGKKALLLTQLQLMRIPQLYAAVIPAGCGKTTFCKKTGALDVDQLIYSGTTEKLVQIRRRYTTLSKEEQVAFDWTDHNTLWYTHLRRVLGTIMMDGHPRLLCVHSEECAVMVGALPIVYAALTDRAHHISIRNREPISKILSVLNLNDCKNNRLVVPDQFSCDTFDKHEDLFDFVSTIAMAIIPLAFPLQFTTKMPPSVKRRKYSIYGYDDAVSEVFLTGDIEIDMIDEASRLHSCGHIPSACFNQCVVLTSGGLPFFGNNTGYIYHWAMLIDEIHALTEETVEKEISWHMVVNNASVDWYCYFPCGSTMEAHRINIHLRDILNYAKNHCNRDELLHLLNRHVYTTHYNMMCTIMVYYIGIICNLRSELQELIWNSRLLFVAGRAWTRVHKEFHNLVRTTGHFSGLRLTEKERHALMYSNALYGREVYTMNPMVEINKRLEDTLPQKQSFMHNMWSTTNYIQHFNEAMQECYAEMARARPRWTNINKFWELRASWATQGSLTLCPKEYKQQIEVAMWLDDQYKLIETNPQKKALLETLDSPGQIVEMLYENAGLNLTRTAPKPNEAGGKERVLLPGSLMHYIAVTYVIGAFDRSCEVGNTGIGSRFGDNHILAFEHYMRHGSWFFMYDFEDHNTQHSLYEMAKTIEYVGLMYRGADPSFPFMVDYIVDGFFKMGVIDADSNIHRVSSGLYSGWRNTMWTNVIMSYCYLRVAEKAYYNYFHARAPIAWDVRGDDVVIEIHDLATIIRFYSVMNACGYRSQISKQLVAEFKEFLRLTYYPNKVYDCVNRTLPAYVCGEFERSDPNMYERLLGLWMNTELLRRRGMDAQLLNHCFECMIRRWAKLPDGRFVSRVVLHTTKKQFGLGIPDTCGRIWKLARPLVKFDTSRVLIKPLHHKATKDYLFIINDRLKRYDTYLMPSGQLLDKLATGSFTTNKIVNQVMLEQTDSSYVEYLTQVGSPVVGYFEPSTRYDFGRLLNCLSMAGSYELSKFLAARAEFSALYSLRHYIAHPQKLNPIMSHYPDMPKLESLEFGTTLAYTVSEYMYSHVRDYVEFMVATGMCDDPKQMVEEIINAYALFVYQDE